MSELIPASFTQGQQLSTHFQNVEVTDDLSAGVQSSFGLIGYKGKVWSIRYRGADLALMRDDGDGPRNSIEVILLNSSKNIAKVWYENGYTEGSNAAPDCFSNNGVTPEPTSTKRQSLACASCPHNQWGSRVTNAGKQGKSCADSKRVAVVPSTDINNDAFGGPMLLRVPAASLQDLAFYGQKLAQIGYPYYAAVTKIAFDPNESYPKFQFQAVRPLTDQEAQLVLSIREGHTVNRILSENEFQAAPQSAGEAPTAASVFEQPPATGAQSPIAQRDPTNPMTNGQPTVAQQAAVNTQPVQQVQQGTVQQPDQPVQQAQPVTPQVTQPVQQSGGFGNVAPIASNATGNGAAQATAQNTAVTTPVQEQPAQTPATPATASPSSAPVAISGGFGNVAPMPDAAGNGNAVAAAAQSTVAAQPVQTASPSNDSNMASSFEDELDGMLNQLLPS